jgi:acetyl-CoA/propionyl-CoA carboxylase biotin carboxyl carrier protein
MNTRLQVEHPVTELVTGLDLVALQLRIADGDPLPFSQADVVPRGAAIECRVNAEDPTGGRFLPSPGTITRFRPAGGFGVRVDAGYQEGDVLPGAYDSLVAKILAWGPDRDTARRRLIRALEETEIAGVATTIPAQLAILRHPDFGAGRHYTSWVEAKLDFSALGPAAPGPAEPPVDGEARVARDVDVEVDGRRYNVRLWVPEVAAPVRAAGPVGRAATAAVSAGARLRPRSRPAVTDNPAGSGTVLAPMQGTVIVVSVAPGDVVTAGQSVCVLEAMKMENNVTAERDGTVTEVKVQAGDTVGAGDVLVVIE